DARGRIRAGDSEDVESARVRDGGEALRERGGRPGGFDDQIPSGGLVELGAVGCGAQRAEFACEGVPLWVAVNDVDSGARRGEQVREDEPGRSGPEHECGFGGTNA